VLYIQIDSLIAVSLPNRRILDLLTAAEKHGVSLFLEECYFYVNQTGLVREVAKIC
jgi:hypothetical protein